MPRPTPPVKRVCYADDITDCATGPKIPQLESMINSYLREVPEGKLAFDPATKSTVTLLTQDKHQFQTHPDITLGDSPKILGAIIDLSLPIHKHSLHAVELSQRSG